MRLRTLVTAGCSTLLLASAAAVTAAPHDGRSGVPDRGQAQWRADKQEMNWVYRGVNTLEVDQTIKHYKWELDVGGGPYDKIAVHRYVRETNNTKAIPERPAPDHSKVLFIINGTYAKEGTDLPAIYDSVYFPQQGYDVWTMDFRTAYLPTLSYEQFEEKYPEGLQSTANWTYDVFREDIKKAVELTKKVARTNKIFMAGRSRGGTQMYIYAAKYAEDLKGLIGLDGGPVNRNAEDESTQRVKTREEFEQQLAEFRTGAHGRLLAEVGLYENGVLQGAIEDVDEAVGGAIPFEGVMAPDGSYVKDLTDSIGYIYGANNWSTSNYYVHQDKEIFRKARANYTRYWPAIQSFETSFLEGYADAPFLDYDDTGRLNLPVIHFESNYSCPDGDCTDSATARSIPSHDHTVKYFPTYGHVDIYYGTSSIEDIKKPMLDWMNARR